MPSPSATHFPLPPFPFGIPAGAAIYGSEAGTWIDFLTLVINKKISGDELRSMIFAFLTQTYMIASTLSALLRK